MKKVLSMLLALTMMLSLAACAKEEAPAPEVEKPSVSEPEVAPEADPEVDEAPGMNDLEDEQAVAPLPEEDLEENEVTPEAVEPEAVPEPEVKPEVAPAPAPTPAPETTPDVTPEVAPEVTPEVAPEVTPEVAPETTPEVAPEEDSTVEANACDAFFASVLKAFPEFPAQMKTEGEFLTMTYPGLADVSTNCAVYMPMISAVAAEIAIVETSDAAAVKSAFQARMDYQIEQGGFYPATIEAWKNNAQIVEAGNYVMLVVCPEEAPEMTTAIVDLFTATFG